MVTYKMREYVTGYYDYRLNIDSSVVKDINIYLHDEFVNAPVLTLKDIEYIAMGDYDVDIEADHFYDTRLKDLDGRIYYSIREIVVELLEKFIWNEIPDSIEITDTVGIDCFCERYEDIKVLAEEAAGADVDGGFLDN